MRYIVLLLMLLGAESAVSQTQTPQPVAQPDSVVPKSETPLSFAEEMPTFPGGQGAFQKYLQTNLQYPDSAKKYGREGTVYIYFEIAKDGSVENVQCKKGVEGAPELAEEAVRVISAMPNWVPGRMNRKAVKVSMTIPVKFTLQ